MLRSATGRGNLLDDLLRLGLSANSDNLNFSRIKPLLVSAVNNEPDNVTWDKVYGAVTESTPPPRPVPPFQQTPLVHSTGSFVNTSEYRKYVDDVLRQELGLIHDDVYGFYDAYFGDIPNLKPAAAAAFRRCTEGDDPMYKEGDGWRQWPRHAEERNVLNWLAELTGRLSNFGNDHRPAGTQRRPLALPHQPLQGSIAQRKLDIGFVNDPNAGTDSKCDWSQILVPGELKSNPAKNKASMAGLDLGRYAREVLAAQDARRFVLGFTLCGSFMRLWEFDRLGGIASAQFDINQNGLQFVSVILGFLWMNDEQLGFDPTINTSDGERYIEIERDGETKRIIIDQCIKRVRCVAGRATTCWKGHVEGDDSMKPLVIKDSWQYPEREEEGELLREATGKGVINVARYYHHETVSVNGKEDDVRDNVRRGLDVTRKDEKQGRSTPPPSTIKEHRIIKRPSISVARQKRSSSSTGASLPPPKRSCSASSVKAGTCDAGPNRVRRRVIVRDYGKAIYKSSTPATMLATLQGCIEGYESLHEQAGMLQRDISPNNLMVNEEGNGSWPAFLIDLDFAIKEEREGFSGARGKTGTRAFMAIGVLLGGRKHSFMDDLESFFWVLFWICIHYTGPNKERVVPQFEKWNYMHMGELAMVKKGTVAHEGDFLKAAEENFTQYYKPLVPWVNRLRRVVFPNGARWETEDKGLYSRMKILLGDARKALEDGSTA